ncbi:MAG: hypothetical protein FDZ70_03895 [Actinobacteria bacterium]|nr:MAG: hypothetical protein FDZ70_03895 [Actinomycetota bacterium]
MELDEVLSARHSCREFTTEPVPREAVDRLVAAAAAAPSSMNAQPTRLHFVSGERRQLLGEVMALTTRHLEEYVGILPDERIRDASRFFSTLGDAPVVLVLSQPKSSEEIDRLNMLLATGCVLDNVLLKAADLGLASCCITFGFWVRDQLAEVVLLPPEREVVALVVLGYPEGASVAPPHRTDIAEFLE